LMNGFVAFAVICVEAEVNTFKLSILWWF